MFWIWNLRTAYFWKSAKKKEKWKFAFSFKLDSFPASSFVHLAISNFDLYFHPIDVQIVLISLYFFLLYLENKKFSTKISSAFSLKISSTWRTWRNKKKLVSWKLFSTKKNVSQTIFKNEGSSKIGSKDLWTRPYMWCRVEIVISEAAYTLFLESNSHFCVSLFSPFLWIVWTPFFVKNVSTKQTFSCFTVFCSEQFLSKIQNEFLWKQQNTKLKTVNSMHLTYVFNFWFVYWCYTIRK